MFLQNIISVCRSALGTDCSQGLLSSQVLLDLTNCENTAVQERALDRIQRLSRSLVSFPLKDVRTPQVPPARPCPPPCSSPCRAAAQLAAPGSSPGPTLGSGFWHQLPASALLLFCLPPPGLAR